MQECQNVVICKRVEVEKRCSENSIASASALRSAPSGAAGGSEAAYRRRLEGCMIRSLLDNDESARSILEPQELGRVLNEISLLRVEI